MKYLVAIAALFILARPVMPVAEYLINYDYISKVLCINKEKPQLKCNGKCHLMKQLAKAAEDQKPLTDKKGSHAETEVLFFQALPTFDFNFKNILPETIIVFPVYTNLYTHLNFTTVFHPPAAVC